MEMRSIVKVKVLDEWRGNTKETVSDIEDALNVLRSEGLFNDYEIKTTIKGNDFGDKLKGDKANIHEMLAKVVRKGNYSEYIVWNNVRNVKIESVIFNGDFSNVTTTMTISVYQPDRNETFKNTYYLTPISSIDLTKKVDKKERIKLSVNLLNKMRIASKKRLEDMIIEENNFHEVYDLFEDRDKENKKDDEIREEIDTKDFKINLLEEENKRLEISNENLKRSGGIDAPLDEIEKIDNESGKKISTEIKNMVDEITDEDEDSRPDYCNDLNKLLVIIGKYEKEFYLNEFKEQVRKENIHLNDELCLEFARRTSIDLSKE